MSVDPLDETAILVDELAEEDGVRPEHTILSDPGHRVIDRYGLLNPDGERGIPHPTVFVVDRAGVVRWKFIEIDYRTRPTNAMILDALEGLQAG